MYVPALARAHLAAESVISANKVSLGLKGVAGGQWGRAKGDATLLQRPTLCSRNTYTRVHVRERVYGRAHVHTYELAAVASLEQGGDNKICDNQPQRRRRRHDALSDELSGDVRHVTCTSTPLFSFSPFSCPPSLRPSFLRHTCLPLPLSRFLYLPLSVSIFIIRFCLSPLFLVLSSLSSRRLVQLVHVTPPISSSSFLVSPLQCTPR